MKSLISSAWVTGRFAGGWWVASLVGDWGIKRW